MDSSFTSLDWSLVQAFLAVAETGSLSAAARQLGASQPTLGRQISAIEQALGAPLFARQPRGLALNETGAALLAPARAMREAAGQMMLTAAGRDEGLSGVVRVTASVMVAHYLLPPVLARIRACHPEIELELVASDTTENLLFSEADIALRMYRPEQLDMITRHLGDLRLGLFGARSYLERAGRPEHIDELLRYQLVGFDRSEAIVRAMRAQDIDVDPHAFAMRCDNQAVYWELVRAGCGLGFGQIAVGAADPLVEQILTDAPIKALPVWLTAHKALRYTPRLRRVWDMLSEGLSPHLS